MIASGGAPLPRGENPADMEGGAWLEVTLEELLSILVCPGCKSPVKLARDCWLVCSNEQCQRKYPIRDGIPIMLVEEGDRYVDVPVDALQPPGPMGSGPAGEE